MNYCLTMCGIVTLALVIAVPTVLGAQEGAPPPDFADERYGPHERNVFDLWLPETDEPAPLVLYIHGGGFRQGDKSSLGAGALRAYLRMEWAVAAINYRLTDTAPAPAAYLDSARAVQHLRHHARQWNIDPTRIASTGGSAGAGTSLWLAFHDDLAQPDSPDLIARQSTRLTCVVVHNAQSSYDPRFAESIGIPRPNFERHNFFLPFYDITKDQIDTPEAYRRYEEAAPITYLTGDDPPVMMTYSYPNEPVTAESPLGLVVHHPLFGIALKREMDKLGVECVVQYLDPQSGRRVQDPEPSDGQLITGVEFIRRHFDAAGK